MLRNLITSTYIALWINLRARVFRDIQQIVFVPRYQLGWFLHTKGLKSALSQGGVY
jgi:hypothetical protein